MKYGILLNKNNRNIGDDIQAYATAQFLPSVDYFIDREDMPSFTTDDEGPAAVIMNAWYMWKKWNWPPSKYIYPLFVGFHYADHQLAKQPGSPIKYELLHGEGAAYLNAWGPIGCRDHFTEEHLKEIGVDAFFSGCITLTLPKQEKQDRGRYICVVDVDPRVTKKIKDQLGGSGIEVRVMTHNRERDPGLSWEAREADTVERLTEYQNAICVVTKRLHCALPCLAMEVPVLLVKDMTKDIRFDPYYDFLHWVRPGDFLKGKCSYDFANPPENKPDYKPYRQELIERCQQFVKEVADDWRSVAEADRYGASEEKVLTWRSQATEQAIELWKQSLEADAAEFVELDEEKRQLLKELGSYRKTYTFSERMQHRFHKVTDKSYGLMVPDYEREWEKIDAEMAKADIESGQEGITALRRRDERDRRMCTRLLEFSENNFYILKKLRKDIGRMRKQVKEKSK